MNKKLSGIPEMADFTGPMGLYVHVPFCESKCDYCDFYSVVYKKQRLEAYLGALQREIEIYGRSLNNTLETIYIGGGTPSLLTPGQLERLLSHIFKYFSLPRSREITLEANPASLSENRVDSYRQLGINRLSLGVQSFQNNELKLLGRQHRAERALIILGTVASVFNNYSFDLMFAFPGQQLSDWEYSLKKAVELAPPHISLYNLEIKEETPLGQRLTSGQLSPVSEETDARMYQRAREILLNHGYQHYEISNFALDGYQSRHNKIYWHYRPYLGLGPAAHSFSGRERFFNVSEIDLYLKRLDRQRLPIEETISLSRAELQGEWMMMGLRLLSGVSRSRFNNTFNCELDEIYGEQLSRLKEAGLIEDDGQTINLTDRGLMLANRVFMAFLPE